MQIDLAGTAAILAVPASLFVGLWTARRMRGLEDRIERTMDLIDRMPKRSAEREVLEATRDELVFQLASRTFNRLPLGSLLGLTTLGFLYIGIAAVWKLLAPNDDSILRILLLFAGSGMVLLAAVFSVLTVRAHRLRLRHFREVREDAIDYFALSAFGRWKHNRRVAIARLKAKTDVEALAAVNSERKVTRWRRAKLLASVPRDNP